MSLNITVEKTTTPKTKPDQNQLGFGQYFTDHMLIVDYTEGTGWHDARIVPYQPLILDPAAMVLHYGQAIFEGMKAYKTKEGKTLLFRPSANMERVNVSNARVCIPPIQVDDMVEAIAKLVKVEEDWIPTAPGTSLYIRPFIIATEAALGVKVSSSYQFIVILSPVGAYYKEGLNPVKIYVEPNYVRAVKGGTGFAKTPGNYAASLIGQVEAKEKGYTQVLWLDAIEKKYVEEVGTMNVFFVIGDEIVTPELNGSILPGITRRSCVELLKSWGMNVSERRISLQEIIDANQDGKLVEAFGSGTAAVISPIGELNCNGEKIVLNNGKIGEISQKLYDTITKIQYGELPDTLNWTYEVK